MSKSMNHLISLVSVELEDLVEDLKVLEQAGIQRYKEKQITEYVMKENFALFELEIHALQGLQTLLEPEKWNSIQPQDFFQSFKHQAQKYLIDHQYPTGLTDILDRKLKKVEEFFL